VKRNRVRRPEAIPPLEARIVGASAGIGRPYARAFEVSNRAWGQNPKIGVFYLALIPQYSPANAPHVAMGVLLAMMHDAEGLVWFTAIIVAIDRARNLLSRSIVCRTIDKVAGSILLGFGARIALISSG
jgi:threonine/homoserine/homoserine lactone efflux protein